jgi:hypothetical protein
VEPRYTAIVLVGAGLPKFCLPCIAEANPINFAAHIRTPKLILNGRYDEDTALKTEAEPLFKLLPEPKRLVVYDGGHVPPAELQMSETTAWLDATVGPVRRE